MGEMNDEIYNVEDILLDYEPERLSATKNTDYEDVSAKQRSIYNDNGRYYDIWVTFEGNDSNLVQEVINDYDTYELHFANYLEKNGVDYIEINILTDDEGGVTFSVTIDIDL